MTCYPTVWRTAQKFTISKMTVLRICETGDTKKVHSVLAWSLGWNFSPPQLAKQIRTFCQQWHKPPDHFKLHYQLQGSMLILSQQTCDSLSQRPAVSQTTQELASANLTPLTRFIQAMLIPDDIAAVSVWVTKPRNRHHATFQSDLWQQDTDRMEKWILNHVGSILIL